MGERGIKYQNAIFSYLAFSSGRGVPERGNISHIKLWLRSLSQRRELCAEMQTRKYGNLLSIINKIFARSRALQFHCGRGGPTTTTPSPLDYKIRQFCPGAEIEGFGCELQYNFILPILFVWN